MRKNHTGQMVIEALPYCSPLERSTHYTTDPSKRGGGGGSISEMSSSLVVKYNEVKGYEKTLGSIGKAQKVFRKCT